MSALTPNQEQALRRRMIHQSFLQSTHDPITVPNAPPVVPLGMQLFLILTGILTVLYLVFGY